MKEIVKVLGLCWNIKRDKLSLYSRPEPVSRTPVTKREILCHTSSVFDPLGLVTPVTITAKRLLQELWQDSVPWDTVLNDTYSLSGLLSQQTSLSPHNSGSHGSSSLQCYQRIPPLLLCISSLMPVQRHTELLPTSSVATTHH